MKLLFQLGYPGLLRMFGSTVRELSDRGHEVLLAYDMPDKKRSPAAAEIEALPGVAIVDPVPWRSGGSAADVQRRAADYLRYLDPRFEGTPYKDRLERKTPKRAVAFGRRRWARHVAKPIVRALVLRDRLRRPDAATLAYVRDIAPDGVLVTPLISRGVWGARQTDTVKAAKALGIPVGAAIGSWDHLTTKGVIKSVPDRVILWNGVQEQEAVELHRVPRSRVVITGAQAFDQWFSRGATLTREAFTSSVGLQDGGEYLLYVGSSPNITPAEREIPFVESWLRALRGAGAPLEEIGVLIRPHPGNMDAWAGVDLSRFGAQVAPRVRPGIPMDEADEALYFHSIHFSSAIVGINTSAIIESLIQRRPVFTLRAPEFAQEDTLHFRYLLPDSGGCVKLAATMDEHLDQLRASLADPEAQRTEIERFLLTFVRPHGLEQPATPLVADAIEGLAPTGEVLDRVREDRRRAPVEPVRTDEGLDERIGAL